MGKMDYKQIVIIDLEATCFETKEEQGEQPTEVIEIGVCMLDANTLLPSRKKSYIVRPKYSKISQFCTKLTGYTWDDVKTGIPFGDACNKLAKEYGTRNRIWASWGDGDRLHFKQECKAKGVKYPFGDSHFNVSDIYNLMTMGNKRVSLGNALEALGMKFEGTPHKGCDDAWNTARILSRLVDARMK